MAKNPLGENFFCAGLLPERQFRFVVARNTEVAAEIAGRHETSPQVGALLGEALLGAFFMATGAVKQDRLVVSVQLECSGPVHRLLAFATAEGGLRGVPSRPEATWDGDLILGKGGGTLSVHRWQDDGRKVYSSSVEMRPVGMGKNFEEYMGRSDQVQSFLDMDSAIGAAGLEMVSGYMFQALPGADADDVDAVLELVQGRQPSDLVEALLPGDASAVRGNFVDSYEKVKVLKTGHFFSYCNCSPQKTGNMLFLLGHQKVMDLLEERGTVEVFCEFCKRRYEFTPADIARLFTQNRETQQ